jgi:hypothetical protein
VALVGSGASPVDITAARSVRRGRLAELDRLRGFAVACMIADHLALFAGNVEPIRLTVGRLAMPLFFVLAGNLAGRLRWRHVLVAALGVALPAAAWWIDSPNVLAWWAVGCVVLAGARRLGGRSALGLLVVFGLAAGANGWVQLGGDTYQPAELLGLMAAGALVPRSRLVQLGRRLPSLFAGLGRFPVSVYAGHVVVLTAVWSWVH